jgi:hypothetical protein
LSGEPGSTANASRKFDDGSDDFERVELVRGTNRHHKKN